MAQKRALIVDDSRSARVILGRMLETHGIEIDTAESGEQAIDYLRGARPDVIFMDHLMPGMDGFEAVRAIKGDARTASIPVMMYTSQEGEAYLRDARAIGAVGVLSKTLAPSDVAKALYQLKLLPDRRDMRAQEEIPRPTPQPSLATPATSIASPSPSARESAADLKHFLESSLEQTARRLSNEIRSAIVTPTAQGEPIRARAPRGLIAGVVLFSFIPTLIVGLLLWRIIETGKAQLDQANARMAIVVAEQQTQIEALRAELRRREAAPLAAIEPMSVPYGEPPLAGARVEGLRKLFDRLRAEGFKGKVRVEYFTGDFCLVGNSARGYALASPDLPQRRCDLIGSPYDDALAQAQRLSGDFVALVTATSQATQGAIQVVAANGGRKLSVAYPPQSESLTAGDWNRAAERNHRVEVTLEPASTS